MQVQNYVKEKCEFGGMTSLTQTSTSIPDVMLRLRNRSVPSWPNPERSIDDNDKGVLVGKKTYWAVTGVAEAAYKTIAQNILQCLTERSNDLYEGLDESSVPHSVGCFMVGKDKRRAAPVIVIACKIGDFCHRVMDIIKAAEWWKSFLRTHEGFGRFSLLPYPPRRMGESDTTTSAWAYTFGDAQILYGAPIFFSSTVEVNSTHAMVRQATLGLLLCADGGLFGLTVAHPLTDAMRDQPSGCHTEELTPFYEDSIESGTDSESDSAPQSGLNSRPSTSPSTVQNHTLQQTGDSIQTTGKPILLGRIAFRSSGGPDDSCDWALIDLQSREDPYFRLLRRTVQRLLSDNFFPEEWQEPSCSFPARMVDAISHATRIVILDDDQNLTLGTLSPSQSFICLAGTRKYTSAHNVLLDRAITPGCCGAAVVDVDGNWYGHIVAGNPGSALAYVSPAAQTVREIEVSLDASTVQPLCIETLHDLFETAVLAADHQEMAAFARNKLDLSTRDRKGETLLSKASYLGQERFVETLLDYGADPNASGGKYGNALCAATSKGHEGVVRSLLEAGADLNAQGRDYSSALQVASHYNQQRMIQLLIGAGADVNAQGGLYGTALQAAANIGHEGILRLLLEAGADVNAQAGLHGTALQAAAYNGHRGLLRLLLDAGADIDIQQGKYGSALQAAMHMNRTDIVEDLRYAAANRSAPRREWLLTSSAAKPKFTDKEYIPKHLGKSTELQEGMKSDASGKSHPTESQGNYSHQQGPSVKWLRQRRPS